MIYNLSLELGEMQAELEEMQAESEQQNVMICSLLDKLEKPE
jgi:hypothetical protein